MLLAEVDAGDLELPNENIDIGEPPQAGKYKGADEAYAKLIGKLAEKEFTGISPDLRQNILAYYKDPTLSPPARPTGKEQAESVKLLGQLDQLRAVPAAVPVAQLP